MHKIKCMRCYVRKDIHEITFWICNLTKLEVSEFQTRGFGCKTGCSGFKHLSGQNRKFRFQPVFAMACVARRGRGPGVRGTSHACVHVAHGDSGGGMRRRDEAGRRRPGEALTVKRKRRWTSPVTARTGSGGEQAARRRTAAAGGGRRRRLCTAREGAG